MPVFLESFPRRQSTPERWRFIMATAPAQSSQTLTSYPAIHGER